MPIRKSAPNAYSTLQIRLHWLVFALLVAQFLLSGPISEAFDQVEDGLVPDFHPLVAAHVGGGLLIFVLATTRFWLRIGRGVPPLPEGDPPLLKLAAHVTHYSLYALLFALPVSGAVAWFGDNEGAAGAHGALRLILLVLIVLHVAAALYHHFIRGDGMLDRMRTGDPS